MTEHPMTDATPLASEQITQAGQFLLDRLVDHEVRMTSGEDAREWHGHVTPAMARFRAALSASPAPSGWKLVPIEPTSEMTEAGEDANHYSGDDIIRNRADPVYRAMIEAAPAPSDQDASQEQGEVPKTIDQAAQRASEATGLQVSVRRSNADVRSHAPMSYRIHVEAPGGRSWTARAGMNRDECKEALFMLASVAALSPAPGATAQDGERKWFPHLDFAGEPMQPGQFREPYPMAEEAPTPTIPAGMVAWNGGENAPEDWDGGGVVLRNGSTMFPSKVSLAYHANGTNRWNHKRENRNPGWDIIAYTPLAAAPKQAEQQGVERAARAMCIADGLDPDEHIIGGQATGFEDFGPLWQAEERSEGQLGLTNYKRLALAALNAPTGAVGKGEAK